MARPRKNRIISSLPSCEGFIPLGYTETRCCRRTTMTIDEYETLRLIDYMGLTQEECATRMAVSRPTVTRIYEEARRKMADMLVNGRELTIGGGDVVVCTEMRPECANEEHCCHRKKDLVRGWRELKETKAPVQESDADNMQRGKEKR